MKFGSVCSGIEAASVAWGTLGWKAAWFSEIEKFPCAVLAHHYPDTPNLGDMTTLPARILSAEICAPDIFCGGTPCQAFSVAGLRQSLGDARGNLSLTFCEIADAIDHVRAARGEPASIVFWENVPGVLSTKDNAFGCFLGALAGTDTAIVPGGRWTDAGVVDGPKRTVAWRTLDAQYFGLAQRRRRVFVVASARDDFDPAAVLFEWEGLRRDSAPSREAGQSVAPTVGTGAPFSRTGNDRVEAEAIIAQCLTTGTGRRYDAETETILPIAFHPTQDPISSANVCHAIGANSNATAAVMQPLAFDGYNQTLSDTCQTIRADKSDGDHVGMVMQSVAVAIGLDQEQNAMIDGFGTLKAKMEGGGFEGSVMTPTMQVRRLTPVECERLQGFPDNYTNIKDKCPDGPRYKALGNSWAVPVVRWIGARIQGALNAA